MAHEPWFKFYAADYLIDPDVDALPREAEGLLIRMWVICHIEGSCPSDPEELARKTRCNLEYVLQSKPHCEPFFDLHDGRLYSHRMEAEKRRSAQARENANKRYKQKGSVIGSANGSADGDANCIAQSQSQKENIHTPQPSPSHVTRAKKKATKTPLPDDFTLSDEVQKWAKRNGYDRLEERLEQFKDQALAKGYRYANWDAAFKNAIRNDWAKLNNSNGGGNTEVSQTLPLSPSTRLRQQLEGTTTQSGGIQ